MILNSVLNDLGSGFKVYFFSRRLIGIRQFHLEIDEKKNIILNNPVNPVRNKNIKTESIPPTNPINQ